MSGDDKPRRLSDEDQALWLTVTRSIVPLKRRRMRRDLAEGARPAAKSHPSAHSKSHAKAHPPSLRAHAAPARVAVKTPPPLMPIDRRLKQRLARGQIEIDARLDLHG